MTSTDELVEGELVPYDTPPAPTLFGTTDPEAFVAKAGAAADALATVIRKQGLCVTIRGREHVLVEGWTLLGSLLGVFPVTEWTRPLDDGWEARVVARTRAGELVGAAESMTTRQESRWRTADEYAVRSMAQTRATSKALRQPLGFVMSLAGFEETPAEEIPPEPEQPAREPIIPPAAQPTAEQLAAIRALVARLTKQQPDVDWPARCREIAGVPGDKLTRGGADGLLRKLQALDREPGEVPFE